mmetsp:Transcript_18295/g.55035  ORF Transcript_18295/g.55035 Transcript_18295/m.55035 type:complete len:240 (-) Transcript_18295:3215-3934(-)
MHHEAERDLRDDGNYVARVRQPAPLRAPGPGRRLHRDVRGPGSAADGDHGLRQGVVAAQCRGQWRVRWPDGHPSLPSLPRRCPPQHLHHPHQRPRHQPGQRHHGGHEDCAHLYRRQGQHRHCRAQGEGRAAQGQLGGVDDHVPEHPRRVRGGRGRHLQHHPRQRRAGLHGRRQHERPGGSDVSGPHRRGRVPPEPAQDLLHPPRRRRARHGPHRREGTLGSLPALPPPHPHRCFPRLRR